MASSTTTVIRQLFQLPAAAGSAVQFSSFPRSLVSIPDANNSNHHRLLFSNRLGEVSNHRNNLIIPISKASPVNDGISTTAEDDDDGVSLGTMKLPLNTDVVRFESLLFQVLLPPVFWFILYLFINCLEVDRKSHYIRLDRGVFFLNDLLFLSIGS